jgi:hypothetical protein
MAKRFGTNYWQNHLQAWERSGLTQAAYCAQHALNAKTFSRWRSRILAGEPTIHSTELTLVPVNIGTRTPVGQATIQLHSPGGWRIELTNAPGAGLGDLLRQLP